MAKLRYNFTFPLRWLKEDRKYLKKNLLRNMGFTNNLSLDSFMAGQESPVFIYGIRLKQHAYQPKPYKITKEELTEIFDKVFPGSTCRQLEKFFVQKHNKSSLPVMELEMYY